LLRVAFGCTVNRDGLQRCFLSAIDLSRLGTVAAVSAREDDRLLGATQAIQQDNSVKVHRSCQQRSRSHAVAPTMAASGRIVACAFRSSRSSRSSLTLPRTNAKCGWLQ